MGRLRQQTIMLSGQVGYATTPRPDWRLPADRLVSAVNVWLGGNGVCERRYGSTALTAGASGAVTGLIGIQSYPAGITSGSNTVYIYTRLLMRTNDAASWYLSFGALGNQTWATLTVPAEIQSIFGTQEPFTDVATINGKAFLTTSAVGSGAPSITVIDFGSAGAATVRMAGFTTADAGPTVANTGSGSYAAVARYYRVRWATQVASVTTRRSEPSASQSFTPSGSGTAARVTQPTSTTAVSEGATHWEVEASTDNSVFYRLSTVAIGTTTYDDSAATTTYSSNTLSEDVGDRLRPPEGSTVLVDGSYLLIAGHETLVNRVFFSRPGGTTDVADEECFPADNYVDLEINDSDAITALIGPTGDVPLVFKYKSIFRLVRTGDDVAPYEPVRIADIGCPGRVYVCEGPPPGGGAKGEAVYWANESGAWVYYQGQVSCLSKDIFLGNGTDSTTWLLSNIAKVVYYPARQAILFGQYAYSIVTGGWSYMVDSSTLSAFQVATKVTQWASNAFQRGQLVRRGASSGLYLWDDYVGGATTDVGGTTIYGLVQFQRLMPYGHGLRFLVSRCRVWGEMLGSTVGRLAIRRYDSPTSPESTGTTGTVPLGTVTLPVADDVTQTDPLDLGVGSVDYLGLVLRDDQAQAPWRVQAVELSVSPQEPLP